MAILFIGDSHSVGPFGQTLDKHLRTLNRPTTTAAYCGTVVNDFYKDGAMTKCGFLEINPKGELKKGIEGPVVNFQSLLLKTKPSQVIVALATNYSGFQNDAFVIEDMRKMARDIISSGAKCLWIGMPTSRSLKQHHARIQRLTMEAVGGQCTYFDSFKVTSYPDVGGDGVHFYFPGGKEVAENWAYKAFEAFKKF